MKGNGHRMAIIRIWPEKIKFPKQCPVCMSQADTQSTISISPSSLGYDHLTSKSLHPRGISSNLPARGFQTIKGAKQVRSGDTILLKVPTCDDHKTEDMSSRRRVSLYFLMLISLIPTIFVFYQFTNSLFMSMEFFGSLTLFFVLLGIMTVSGYLLYWPSELQRNIEILGISPKSWEIYLQLEKPDYYAAFLSLNEMNVTLVDYAEMRREMKVL